MAAKPSFERIFRRMGVHLAAAGAGFFVAALLFAPKPREVVPVPRRTATILELRHAVDAARGKASAGVAPGAAASAGGTPGAAADAGVTAVNEGAAVRAADLCRALGWPACDADSIRRMGGEP